MKHQHNIFPIRSQLLSSSAATNARQFCEAKHDTTRHDTNAILRFLMCMILLLGLKVEGYAFHVLSADISYQLVPCTQATYLVTLTEYVTGTVSIHSGFAPPTGTGLISVLSVGTSSNTLITNVQTTHSLGVVEPFNDCFPNSGLVLTQYKHTMTVNLASAPITTNTVRFQARLENRDELVDNIIHPDSFDMIVFAEVRIRDNQGNFISNNSVQSYAPTALLFCSIAQSHVYVPNTQSITEPDGSQDALNFMFANPLCSNGTVNVINPVPFNGTLTPATFMLGSGWQTVINPNNGNITFTPISTAASINRSSFAVDVVETRMVNGSSLIVGRVHKEYGALMLNCGAVIENNLSITSTASPLNPTFNSPVTLTYLIQNPSSSNYPLGTNPVSISDLLPPCMQYVSHSINALPGQVGVYNPGTDVFTYTATSNANFLGNTSASITINATYQGLGFCSHCTNMVNNDCHSGDNTTCFTVGCIGDLSISKTLLDPNPNTTAIEQPIPGQVVSFQIQVANVGMGCFPSPIALKDILEPTCFTYNSYQVSGTNVNANVANTIYNPTNGEITYTGDPLDPNAVLMIQIDATYLGGENPCLNCAEILTLDCETSNNQSCVTIPPPSDLVVEKTCLDCNVGSPTNTFVLTIKNVGGPTAAGFTDVNVLDIWETPCFELADFQIMSANVSPAPLITPNGNSLEIFLANLSPGEEVQIQVTLNRFHEECANCDNTLKLESFVGYDIDTTNSSVTVTDLADPSSYDFVFNNPHSYVVSNAQMLSGAIFIGDFTTFIADNTVFTIQNSD
ncbi:MAG: hypothetical protein ACKVTZ_20875, partial [Bacteroidia bacterium]